MAARRSIGVFAAMITCDHERSKVFRIDMPSRIIDTSGVLDSRWNASALRSARANVRMRPPEDPISPIDPRHAEVYDLADEGQSAQDIARHTGRPSGEVELILALRGR